MDINVNSTEMRLIEAECGIDIAELLIRQFGGQEFRVPAPENLTDTHRLSTSLGWPIALKICTALGVGASGVKITVPLGGTSLAALRSARIEQYLRARKSINETARLSGAHVRTVFRRRAELKHVEKAELTRLFKEGGSLEQASRQALFHTGPELVKMRAQILAEKSLRPTGSK